MTDAEQVETKPAPNDLKCWPHTLPGDTYSTFLMKYEKRNACFNQYRVNDKKPSNTLSSTAGLYTHWSKCRTLTYREWKRLGSFPDDYQAKTDKIGKYMIGMSVPPKMTEVVARAVCEQWLNAKSLISLKKAA